MGSFWVVPLLHAVSDLCSIRSLASK